MKKKKIMSMKRAMSEIEDSPEDIKADKMLAKKLIKSKYAKGGTIGDQKERATKYGTNQEDFDDEEEQSYSNSNTITTSKATDNSSSVTEPRKKTLLERYQENKGGYKRALAGGIDKDGNATDPKTGLKYKVSDNDKISTKQLQTLTDKDKTSVDVKQVNKNMIIKNNQRLDSVKDNYLPPSSKKPVDNTDYFNLAKKESKFDNKNNPVNPIISKLYNPFYINPNQEMLPNRKRLAIEKGKKAYKGTIESIKRKPNMVYNKEGYVDDEYYAKKAGVKVDKSPLDFSFGAGKYQRDYQEKVKQQMKKK